MSIAGKDANRPGARRRAKPASAGEGAGPAPGRRRPRGRPARLSRERVVDAVLAILEEEPDEVPTIARIAREVEAVPAALYRHFECLDDILDGVLARVIQGSPSVEEEGADWSTRLERWMRDLRSRLLQAPAVIAMIGRSGRTSPAWLEASSTLVEILQHAGLSGSDLAATYLWVLETTVGLVLQEAAQSIPEQIANARASGHELGEVARARFAPLVHEFARIDGEEFFSFAVDQATAVVELRRASARRA